MKTIALATIALLLVTKPVYATTIGIEDINLDFGNGYTEVGTLGVAIGKFTSVFDFPILSFDGTPISITNFSDGEPDKLYQFPTGGGGEFLLIFPQNFPGAVSNFALNGVHPVSGTVTLDSVSYAPLPPSLPLFGGALLALLGFSWWRNCMLKKSA